MKRILTHAALAIFLLAFPVTLSAQCTPGDETTCPDPENNGQICPETLPNALLNELYSQEFTIIAPPEYVLDSSAGIVFELHHITLKSIDNMPPGITWVSNAQDSVFNVGTYYCVLLEGTPTQKGEFPLKIVVDVYLPGIFGSPPIYVATVADSTSLVINVTDPNGIGDRRFTHAPGFTCFPNPFSEAIDIQIQKAERGEAFLELYTLTGQLIRSTRILITREDETFSLPGADLHPGVYLLKLRNSAGAYTQRIVRSN